MFYELANQYRDELTYFYPCDPIVIRDSWEQLNITLREKLIKQGESYLNFSYPALPATSFMAFCRTGNRTRYEELYFSRRLALNSLVIAECVENKGRFLDDIINGIFVLCEESAWQLPAHNSYIRDTPNHILPDKTSPILDLFACETGALLAMIHYLLKDVLLSISPFIITRIEHELNERILMPYLSKHFWWMGNGNEPMCNWTIWCTQNILLTAFLTEQTNHLKYNVFKKACESVDYFLKDYGEDGCCDEGAGYYRHAGLCLFNAMEVLNSITKGYFSHLYEMPKIRNMADYINEVHMDGSYYINFSDCSPKAGAAGAREFLFGKRTHNLSLMSFAAEDYKRSSDPLLTSEINLFYRIQALWAHEEILTFKPQPVSKGDIYYPSVGLFITRDSKFCLAVKAGDNDDNHNHNDTGSFTLYKEGKPMFIDIGVESYTQKTFSPKRYEIWTMQSDYHNLPTLNGFMQEAGAAFRATEVQPFFSERESSIEMELATAYPQPCQVNSYKRKVTLEKEKQIIITDHADFGHSPINICLNLMTYEAPVIKGQKIDIGTLGSLTIEGDVSHIDKEILPITDARLMQCWEHDIYRLRIWLNSPQITLVIQ